MRTAILALLVTLLACSGDDASISQPTSGAGAAGGTSSGTAGDGGAGAGATGPGSGGMGVGGSGGTAGAGGSGQVECPSSALTPGEHAATIQFDGHERHYEVQVPASYDNTTAIALVLDLHGYSSNSTQQQFISGWEALAETHGFAVIRPDGYGLLQSWNGGDTCCGEALGQDLDDVGLMKAIVAEVSGQLCVDPKRVFVSGLSNGGALSHRLACDAADVFAAAAPVSYPIGYLPISKCAPSRPIAVMHHHGTSDTTVPYNGTFGVASAQESFAQWADNDGCTGTPVETYQKGASHCDTYQACQAGVEVTLCTINGPHILYTNLDDVPIAELAWEFFSQHPLP